jgi:hypothetical protein
VCGSPVPEPANAPSQPTQPLAPPEQPLYPQPPLPYQPYGQQPFGAPPYLGTPQPKKKKTGLMIGLIAGAVVLIGAAVLLYLFVFSGASVVGQWYCEERGQILVFDDDQTVTGYGLTGTSDGDYEYDKGKGTGTITANGSELYFKVNKDELVLTNEQTDDESTFVMLKEKSDVEELVLNAMQGLWSSEEIGEVLEFDNGQINVYSGNGDFEGTYDYDIDNGQGSFSVNGVDFEFFADYDGLVVTDIGNYVKADKSLDIPLFVSEHAMPIAGLWYDTSGTYGTVEFGSDGTAQILMLDQAFAATYTFDAATGTGTLSADATGESTPMTYTADTLVIDGITYSRDYVEQAVANDMSLVEGVWYEITGSQGTVTFYDDGSLAIDNSGYFLYGTYTYNLVDGSGQIGLEEEGSTTTFDFYCDGTTLQIGEATYTRDYVEPIMTIIGIWYAPDGSYSTISFNDASSVYMVDTNGIELNGTYYFDPATGTGMMDVSDGVTSVTYDISLYLGVLTVNGVQYEFDNVDEGL